MAQFQQQQQHQQQHQQNSNQQQQQQLQQHALSGQHSQSSSHNLHQQDKIVGAGSVTADGSMSNSFRGNDQVCPFLATGYFILFSLPIYLALETFSTLRNRLKVVFIVHIPSHYLYSASGLSSLIIFHVAASGFKIPNISCIDLNCWLSWAVSCTPILPLLNRLPFLFIWVLLNLVYIS